MSSDSTPTDESGPKPTRRQVIAALGASGAFGGAAVAGTTDEATGDLGIGGGPMSSELSHLQIDWHEGPESDLPEPGAEGRFYRVTSGGSNYSAGDVLRDDGSSWGLINLGVGSLNADEQNITGTVARTVNVPSDESTVADAVSRVAEMQTKAGVAAEINIESGHTITTMMEMNGGDWGNVTIVSEDATVPVGADILSGHHVLFVHGGAVGPTLDCLVDMQGNGDSGVVVSERSSVTVTATNGVINCPNFGLRVSEGSIGYALDADFHGGQANGTTNNSIGRADQQSIVHANGADFSGSGAIGFVANRASLVGLDSANLSGAGQHALRVQRAAVCNARDADLRNAAERALHAQSGATMAKIRGADCRGADAAGGGAAAIFADESRVYARNATVSDSNNPTGQRGVRALNGAEVNLHNATLANCGNDAIFADNGVQIDADGADLSAAGANAVEAINCSHVNARGANGDNASQIVFYAYKGSFINAQGASAVTDGTGADIRVDTGGQQNIQNCPTSASTGSDPHENDLSGPLNSVGGRGIIFAETTEV